jgi:hypothetical protein
VAPACRGTTHVLIVPTMIEMLLDAGEFDIPGLQVLQYGAVDPPDTLIRALDDAGGALRQPVRSDGGQPRSRA